MGRGGEPCCWEASARPSRSENWQDKGFAAAGVWIPVLGIVLFLLPTTFGLAAGDSSDAVRPSARALSRMVYDSESDQVLLYGGVTGFFGSDLNDMWTYHAALNEWRELFPSSKPPADRLGAMEYDSQSDRTILFQEGRTWAYDSGAGTWSEMMPAEAPSNRIGMGMAYDEESDRIILFGGREFEFSSVFYDDTWAYDFESNSWTEMQPSESPVGRLLHAMAYDAARDRIVLFGGHTGTAQKADTWAYDYNNDTWTFSRKPLTPRPAEGLGRPWCTTAIRR